MLKSGLLINNHFTIKDNYIYEENNTHTFFMDIILILFISWIFAIFIEAFREHLRRPRNNDADDDDYIDGNNFLDLF